MLGNIGFKDADAGRMKQEHVPVSEVKVAIRIPKGRKEKGMRLIRADRATSFLE